MTRPVQARAQVLTRFREISRRSRLAVKLWNQERTTYDIVGGNAVWRQLTEGEKVENRREAWERCLSDVDAIIRAAQELQLLARYRLGELDGTEG